MSSSPFRDYRPGVSTPYRVSYPWFEAQNYPPRRLEVGTVIEIPRNVQIYRNQANADDEDWDTFLERESSEDVDFLCITSVIRNDQNRACLIRGYRLRRLESMGGLLPAHVNELCLLGTYYTADDRHELVQWLDEVDFDSAFEDSSPIIRELIFTNAAFPDFSLFDARGGNFYPFDENRADLATRLVVKKTQTLVCRYLAIDYRYSRHDKRRLTNRSFRRLSSHQADQAYGVPDIVLASKFLTYNPVDEDITFGDGFCGCGGVSMGARAAGLKVIVGFDHDADAMRSWESHNLDADCFNMDFEEFLRCCATDYRVAVLHLSFPCQSFSPANTQSGRRDPASIGGKRDESNSAITLSLETFLTKMRPRVITLEQTFGLESRSDHRPYLLAMLLALTSQQYSAAYKVVDMSEFGVPHRRKRLIIMGSCIGTMLPAHPAETHGNFETGRQRLTSINDCLRRVSIDHPDHDPRAPILKYPKSRGDQLLSNGFTTGGSVESHPSGAREYTVAESLALMTFPASFRFPQGQNKTSKRRQIGNSVPPLFAEVLMRTIRESLQLENQRWSCGDGSAEGSDDLSRESYRTRAITVRSASVATESTIAPPTDGTSVPPQNLNHLYDPGHSNMDVPRTAHSRRMANTANHKRAASGSAAHPFSVGD